MLFDNLPESIEEKSIQVKGNGKALLKDVKFKQSYFSEIPDKDLKLKNDQLLKLNDNKVIIHDKINQANKEKTFIENISIKLTSATKINSETFLDPDKWVKMVEFYRSKMITLDSEIRAAEKELRSLENEVKKIKQQIKSISHGRTKSKNQIQVIIDIKQKEEVSIDLSYLVYGPAWQPFYDIRVSSNNKNMNITYNALI